MGRDRTYRVVNRVGSILLRSWGVRMRARGLEHLPADGPVVLAANHTGFLDFVLVGWAARERRRLVRFTAKASTFTGASGVLMHAMGHVPVERWAGASGYRRARAALADGQVVGVFPEATISRSFRLKPLKRGAAALALSGGGPAHEGRPPVPLVPLVVWGGHRLLTVDGRRTLRRGVAVDVVVGEPLVPLPGEDVGALTARLHDRLAALLDEAIAGYPQAPVAGEDPWWVPADLGGTAPDVATGAALDREALHRIGAPHA